MVNNGFYFINDKTLHKNWGETNFERGVTSIIIYMSRALLLRHEEVSA